LDAGQPGAVSFCPEESVIKRIRMERVPAM